MAKHLFNSETAREAGKKSKRRSLLPKAPPDIYNAVMTTCAEHDLEGGVPQFMAAIMMGENPTKPVGHALLPFLADLDERIQNKPKQWAAFVKRWNDVYAYAQEQLTPAAVPFSMQVDAAKTLMEYLYAKRKAVEVKGTLEATAPVINIDLSGAANAVKAITGEIIEDEENEDE